MARHKIKYYMTITGNGKATISNLLRKKKSEQSFMEWLEKIIEFESNPKEWREDNLRKLKRYLYDHPDMNGLANDQKDTLWTNYIIKTGIRNRMATKLAYTAASAVFMVHEETVHNLKDIVY